MTARRTVEQLLRDLVQVGIALSSERDVSVLLRLIVSSAREITQAEAGTLFIREGSTLRFGVVQNDVLAERLGEAQMTRQLAAQPLPLDAPSLAGYVARTGEVLNIRDASSIPADRPYRFNPEFDRRNNYRSRSFLVVPLTDPTGRILGVLQLINALDASRQAVPFDPAHEPVIQLLAAQAAAALRNAQLEELSFKDPLTDAYNRRYFNLRFGEELKRFQRSTSPLALVLFDLDNFKIVNDRFGHTAGDGVLKEIAQVLMQQSREYTVMARYGGDEFIALLPNTSKIEALAYAARLGGVVAAHPFTYGQITMSMGVACVPEDGTSGEALIEAADVALYRAKNAGGNTAVGA